MKDFDWGLSLGLIAAIGAGGLGLKIGSSLDGPQTYTATDSAISLKACPVEKPIHSVVISKKKIGVLCMDGILREFPR